MDQNDSFETASAITDTNHNLQQPQRSTAPQIDLPPPPTAQLPPTPLQTPQKQTTITSTSPFSSTPIDAEVSVSVTKPALRNGANYITYQVTSHDLNDSSSTSSTTSSTSSTSSSNSTSIDTDLFGVASIYPIKYPIKTTVYRRWQCFELLQQLLTHYFPFCIIPPLPKPARLDSNGAPLSGDFHDFDEVMHQNTYSRKSSSQLATNPNIPSNSSSNSQTLNQTQQQTSRTNRSTSYFSNSPSHTSETSIIFTGFLHLFLCRISQHPLLSQSDLFKSFMTYPKEDELITKLQHDLNAIKNLDITTYRGFTQLTDINHLQQLSLHFVPQNVYTTIAIQLEQNCVPPNYLPARASVWNLCSSTLEASQGLRTTQQTSSGNTTTAFIGNVSSTTAAANSTSDRMSMSMAPTNLSQLNSPQNQARAVTVISTAADAVALATDATTNNQRQIVLGDVRSEEDGIRVENYLNALSGKLTSLTQVLTEFDKQQSILATSLGSLGGAILQWSRFEMFHHEDVRSILDSFAVALSRPYVETTPSPIRTQIIDYMIDLNKQTECVKGLLQWRISLSIKLSSISKVYNENKNKIASLQQSNNTTQLSIETEVEKLNALNRTLQLERQSQQQYLDLMHAYLMVEIAWWRRVRRAEIKNCVKSYALAMKKVCQERVTMWTSVEQEIGQQLTGLTTTRPFENGQRR